MIFQAGENQCRRLAGRGNQLRPRHPEQTVTVNSLTIFLASRPLMKVRGLLRILRQRAWLHSEKLGCIRIKKADRYSDRSVMHDFIGLVLGRVLLLDFRLEKIIYFS